MSKGIKRVLVIAVVAVALIAITTSVTFAWWDSTKSAIDITTSNTASNVTLTVAKDTNFTNSVKLVPTNAFTDATHATSICIGAFTPTVKSDGVAQDAIDKVDLTYSIAEFTLGTADQKTSNKFVITVNATQANTSGAIQVDTGKLTSGTKYYIHIAFASNITSADAKTFDSNAINLKIVVTASNKATA